MNAGFLLRAWQTTLLIYLAMSLSAENMYTQHHASVSPSHQELTGAVPVFPGPPADAPRGRTVLTDVVTVFPA